MKNWVWVHPRAEDSGDSWRRAFGEMRAAGLDAALVLVANGTSALYESQVLPTADAVLERILPGAVAEGTEVHAWVVALRCNAETVLGDHPDWYSVSRKGDSSRDRPPYIPSYQWLCPSKPGVRKHLATTVDELAGYEDVAGIHLDYIRHPDVILPRALRPKYGLVQDRELAEYDFCYCNECRLAFSDRTGRDVRVQDDPAADGEWAQFRCDSVREVVSGAAATARGWRKQVSAAVFATPALARQYVRQEWETWDLDAVMPMIYHGYYGESVAWVGQAVGEGVVALSGRRPLYAGLFVPELDPLQLREVVAAAAEAGAAGVSLFSHGAMTAEHLAAARQVLT